MEMGGLWAPRCPSVALTGRAVCVYIISLSKKMSIDVRLPLSGDGRSIIALAGKVVNAFGFKKNRCLVQGRSYRRICRINYTAPGPRAPNMRKQKLIKTSQIFYYFRNDQSKKKVTINDLINQFAEKKARRVYI